jgi:peptidoglycan/LPS O-acetylase OafA/YrhL
MAQPLITGIRGRIASRSIALDGLRGLAATAVIFYHSILSLNPGFIPVTLMQPIQASPDTRSVIAKILLSVSSGHMAVMIFFVLSGFVLRLSLGRMTSGPLATTAIFTIRRILRLYPAMFFCIGVMWLLYAVATMSGLDLHWAIKPTAYDALKNALLIDVDWIGVSWTIQVEIFAVPFILIFFFLERSFGLAALAGCLLYCLFSFEIPNLLFNLPRMAPVLMAMCVGMIVADASLLSWFAKAPRWCPWLLATAMFLSMVFFSMELHLNDFARAVIGGCLVGTTYTATESSAFARLLTCPPIKFLGKISYSLYLLNVPVFILLGALAAAFVHVPLDRLDAGVALGVVTTLVTLPIAYLSTRFVEQGGIALGNYLARTGATSTSYKVHA